MLVRTRPYRPSFAFDRSFDRTFDQLTSSFFANVKRTPVVDASWQDGNLVLAVDLPGTPAEHVAVDVAGRTLTIKVTDEHSSWERSLRLGAALDAEQVAANYVDGRLTVTVAAAAPARGPHHRDLDDRPRRPSRRHEPARGARGSARERHQRERLIGQGGQLGRHRHEVALRRDQPDLPTIDARRAAPGVDRVRDEVEVDADRARRAAPAAPSSRWPTATHGTRSLTFGRGSGGSTRSTAASPSRPGSRISCQRSRRSGTRRLSGCWAAPVRRCSSTARTTPARASTVGTSPCMIVNASRSWAPTPTSRRTAPVCGSSTTRHTSRPRTSPVTTPCSTVGSAPPATIVSSSARCAGAASGGADQRLGDRRQQRALVDVPDLDRERERSAARRASTPVSRAARTCSDVAPLRTAQASAGPSPRAGSSSSEHPRRPVDDDRRPGREGADDGRDVATEVVADERLQLDRPQTAAPAGLVEIGHARRRPTITCRACGRRSAC